MQWCVCQTAKFQPDFKSPKQHDNVVFKTNEPKLSSNKIFVFNNNTEDNNF